MSATEWKLTEGPNVKQDCIPVSSPIRSHSKFTNLLKFACRFPKTSVSPPLLFFKMNFSIKSMLQVPITYQWSPTFESCLAWCLFYKQLVLHARLHQYWLQGLCRCAYLSGSEKKFDEEKKKRLDLYLPDLYQHTRGDVVHTLLFFPEVQEEPGIISPASNHWPSSWEINVLTLLIICKG